MAEAAFASFGYRSTEGGQEDHVIGVFVEDIFQSLLKLGHYGRKDVHSMLGATIMRALLLGYSRTLTGVQAKSQDGKSHIHASGPRLSEAH